MKVVPRLLFYTYLRGTW